MKKAKKKVAMKECAGCGGKVPKSKGKIIGGKFYCSTACKG